MPGLALGVPHTEIRVLAAAVGQREAARQMGLSENTVKSICYRSGDSEKLAKGMAEKRESVLHPSAPNAASVLENILADDSKETRTSLSKSARRLAKDAETAPLDQAGDVLQVGKLAALVHGWSSQQVSMRISMFGSSADLLESLPDAQVTLEMDEQPGDPLDDY